MNNIIILKSAEEMYRRNGFASAKKIASKLGESIVSVKEILDNNDFHNFHEKFKGQYLKIEQEEDAEFYI